LAHGFPDGKVVTPSKGGDTRFFAGGLGWTPTDVWVAATQERVRE
jgi:hypothetical protein